MINAKKEFLSNIEKLKVVCARAYFTDEEGPFLLKKGYTEKELEIFLNKLDREYDDGYGTKELYGIIWCEDGIYLTREDYDGQEWWEKHSYPKIPDELQWLKKKNQV